MRSQNQWPEDPLTHLKDYFGNTKSPLWDEMEQMAEENDYIREQLPELENTITELEQQIKTEKLKTRIIETYKCMNADGSVSQTNSNYAELGGNEEHCSKAEWLREV